MLAKLKNVPGMVLSVAGIVVVALSLALCACGGDDSSKQQTVASRSTKTSSPPQPVLPPAPPPTPVDTTPSAPEIEEPTVVVVNEPKEVSYEDAEAAFNERRYNDAVELFTTYTERKSENPWGFYMLGLSAWKAGQFEQAETAFEQAIELDSQHVKSHINLARVYLDSDRPKQAVVRIEEALEIDSESSVAFRLKGRAYRQLGEKNEAIESYRHAIHVDNEDTWSMNNMALIYIEEGYFGDALPPLARAVQLDGENTIFLNNLGMALEGLGHFRAAEEKYRLAVTIDDSYEHANMNLARIEEVLEDPSIESIDLDAVAIAFVNEVLSWSDTMVASEKTEPVGTDTVESETTESESVEPETDPVDGSTPGTTDDGEGQ
jgi:Flp pilus assembly protein TadD